MILISVSRLTEARGQSNNITKANLKPNVIVVCDEKTSSCSWSIKTLEKVLSQRSDEYVELKSAISLNIY